MGLGFGNPHLMGMSGLDTSLLLFINRTLHADFLDPIFVFITNRSYLIIAPLLLYLFRRDKKEALITFGIAIASFLMADWIAHSFKHVFFRPRPFTVIPEVIPLLKAHSYSLPSNHAANSFAFAVPFFLNTKGRLRHLFILLATLVAISRVYVGVHYPTDIIFGAGLGTLVAIAVMWFHKKVSALERHKALLVYIITATSLFRLYYISSGPLDLSPDEAHYWEWSRRLDLSYYSKGPMIAYLIKLGTSIFGNSVFGVRWLAVVMFAFSSYFVYRLGARLYDETAGVLAACLMQAVPMFSVFGMLMTIDAPFIFFLTLSMWLFHLAVSEDGNMRTWILLGITVGLGLLSKYTMAFFFICAILFFVSSTDKRIWLKKAGPYVSLAISIFVFSPVIIWNMQHGWVTLLHTLGHAQIESGMRLSLRYFADFTGSQVGLITPVLFVMMIWAIVKSRKERPMIFWFSLPVLVFFMLKSVQGKVEGNWPLPGYVGGLIAFSGEYLAGYKTARRGQRILLLSALALAFTVTAVAHYPKLLGLPSNLDPTTRSRGWKNMAKIADGFKESMKEPGFIFSDSYQTASELAFYMKGHPTVYCINLGRRMNQYDIWPGFYGLKGYNALFIAMYDKTLPASVQGAFETCEKGLFDVNNYDGTKLRDYTVYSCEGFKGLAPPKEFESY